MLKKLVWGLVVEAIVVFAKVMLFEPLVEKIPRDWALNALSDTIRAVASPQATFWYIAMVTVGLLYISLHVVDQDLRERLFSSGPIALGLAGGIVFRYADAASQRDSVADPAIWFLMSGLAVSLLINAAQGVARKVGIALDWRDTIWILEEREGSVPHLSAWPSRHICTSAHPPMRGLDTCSHEHYVARTRSFSQRWRMKGVFPDELRHDGSPGIPEGGAHNPVSD